MQIYDDSKKKIGTLTDFKDRKIVYTLDTGDKELSFKYPARGKKTNLLKEEYYIRTKTDEYVLKAVKTGSEYNEYTAQLNVEELESQAFPYGFESQEQTIRACLEFAFEDTPWTVGICEITKKRTINIEEATTAWDVLQSCLSTYRCECKIDSINKKIDIYEQIGRDRGCYFVEGMNLRKLTVSSDTYDFYTRIIPIGKDGITIEWLGKPYIENYQYSNKVKTYVWKDERYTQTTSLIEDATAKLEEMSKPYRVFSADVVDLARQNTKYKDVLDYEIGDTVLMISKRTRNREKQRIVKITMYPEEPKKNTVELSNTTKTFAEVQKAETELAKQEAISISNSTTKKLLANYSTTEEIETKITASKEEVELGVMHTLQGYYDKTETDALIELTKGEIELSVSETYQTKEEMGDYSTTEETKALIDITAEEIELEVSKKVNEGEVSSKLSLESEQITISGPRLKIDTEKFKLEPDGTCRIIGGYLETSNDTRLASLWGGTLYFGDKSKGLDAGMLSFLPNKSMLCVGGYGEYDKLGLGYWGGNDVFNAMITLQSTSEQPMIQFNTTFSVIGKEGITEDITFMKNVSHGPNDTFDIDYGVLHIWNGIIIKVD